MIKKLSVFILFFTILFSQGRREENISYNINFIKSFDNITGWNKTIHGWKSKKNKIPSWNTEKNIENTRWYNSLGKINLKKLEIYNVEELTDIVILRIVFNIGSFSYPTIYEGWSTYDTQRIIIFNKNELRNKLIFKNNNEVNQILISSDYSYTSPHGIDDSFLSLKSKVEVNQLIESKIKRYLEDKNNDDNYYFNNFYIDYFIYDNIIQFYLSRETTSSYSQKRHIYGEYEGRREGNIDFKSMYFESPFQEFESFFKKLLD
tara:strand:- start:283 stop:1068 length:786 start_codon:yes stop_codon:yes gene_type:complete